MGFEVCLACDRCLPKSSFPKLPQDAGCDHDRITCRRCWHMWLAVQVESGSVNKISCAQCENVLSRNDVKRLASADTYRRYLDHELKSALSADPDFRWCISAGCQSGQIHDGGNIFRCAACGHRSCVTCESPWHENESCEDYQRRASVQSVQEAASASKVEKTSKLCPGCSRKVQKNGGCDHMTCSLCGYEYCWACLSDYSAIRRDGNSAHSTACRHWRP